MGKIYTKSLSRRKCLVFLLFFAPVCTSFVCMHGRTHHTSTNSFLCETVINLLANSLRSSFSIYCWRSNEKTSVEKNGQSLNQSTMGGKQRNQFEIMGDDQMNVSVQHLFSELGRKFIGSFVCFNAKIFENDFQSSFIHSLIWQLAREVGNGLRPAIIITKTLPPFS